MRPGRSPAATYASPAAWTKRTIPWMGSSVRQVAQARGPSTVGVVTGVRP